MKAVIQRVSSASVKIKEKIISSIKRGLVVFLGVSCSDSKFDIEVMVDKIKNLRIFQDGTGKMNLSIKDIDAEILIISQFTLLADLKKGRRPSFTEAARQEIAQDLYNQVIELLKKDNLKIQEGKFKEYMQVELINDGPVTFVFDTKNN